MRIYLVLAALSLIAFSIGLGSAPLFDWDEINFAESAREMLVTRDWLTVQVNFAPFWEKPPLFIWMQALSMSAFGVGEFGARFPNALAGVFTILSLFHIGRKLNNQRFGLLWAAAYCSAWLPFFYFKSGIIDPWFNLFIFWSIYNFYSFTQNQNTRHAALSALSIGLAILTKGPVAGLIFALCFVGYLILQRFRLSFKWYQPILFVLIAAFSGGFWFVLQALNGNAQILTDFIVYQIRLFQTEDAGHGGFFLYHPVVLLLGVFPASFLALPLFLRRNMPENTQQKGLFIWMQLLFWVVLVLFTIVRTKIIHYSSLAYFPISFFAALQLEALWQGRRRLHWSTATGLAIVGALVGLAVAILPFFDSFKGTLLPYIKDEFAVGNLQANAQWLGFEFLLGPIFLAALAFALWHLQRGNARRGLLSLLGASFGFVFCAMLFIVPQVEQYSQHAAIEFYQSKKDEDCYILPLHKSYAHYFYSDRQPQNNLADFAQLSQGPLDKPAYFVMRNIAHKVADFRQQCPQAQPLYTKNGFAFFRRDPH